MKYILRFFLPLFLLAGLLSADTYDTHTLADLPVSQWSPAMQALGYPPNIESREGDLYRLLVTPEELDLLQGSVIGIRERSDLVAAERAFRADTGYCTEREWPCYYTGSAFTPDTPPEGSLLEHLMELHQTYPSITRVMSIGKSQDGDYDILAMRVTDRPDESEAEPAIRLYGAIHGDETSSMMVACDVLDWILENYNIDADATRLVDSADLWFIPLGNPWGLMHRSRFNSRSIDLNRNFWGPDGNSDPLNQPFTEAETQAIRDLTERDGVRFVTGISLHSGAILYNSVYNHTPTPTPDEPTYFSSRYGGPFGGAIPSEDGLAEAYMEGVTTYGFWYTNGADWYYTWGDTNDWSYYRWTTLDATVEVTTTKWPDADLIPFYTAEHRQAVVNHMVKTFQGISGTMIDGHTGQPLDGKVIAETVADGEATHAYQAVPTSPAKGNFHRVLVPGTYRVTCTAPGYDPLVLETIPVHPDMPSWVSCPLTPSHHGKPFFRP